MNTLDLVSRVSARDCVISGNTVVFMVPEQQMGQAIGKNGSNVKVISERLRKKVELFEYTEIPEKFLEKAFGGAKLEGVEIRGVGDRKVAFVKADAANRKVILGNIGRLKKIKELAERNYGIDEVRVR